MFLNFCGNPVSWFKSLIYFSTGYGSLASDPVSSGVPSFVVQEEFDRYTGYWWEPASNHGNQTGSSVYRILYEEVDESSVEILQVYYECIRE